MPRIPVRVEPYNSPSRQHRHYKNKRDQVLRALGKAAYINGSHFAIMWVSARGDVETYASEALQSRLDEWFVKGGIADEAKQLVKSAGGGAGPGEVKVFEDSDEEGGEDGEDVDVFLDGGDGDGDKSVGDDEHGGKKGRRGPLAPLNTAMANQHFLRSRTPWSSTTSGAGEDLFGAPRSAPLFPTSTNPFASDEPPRTSTPLLLPSSTRLTPRATLSSSSTPPLFLNTSTPTVEITLTNQAARTAFLELRFGQLQQGVCKTVAKAWIKIIEPKKQTRCPYNKGEAGKPDWWPAGVRHKEPDHLMKPERHALLLTILRSPKVKVARLQLATAEVVALIKADKVSLLMDVYRIAREEEKLREKGAGEKDREIRVGVSTLDGWCREGSEPTSQGRQIARSATPEPAAGEKRKRSVAAVGMVKSNSTTAVHKRRSIATTTEVAPKPLLPHRSSKAARNSFAAHSNPHALQHQQQQQQQQQQLYGLGLIAPGSAAAAGMVRSHSFSAAPSFDRTTATFDAAAAAANAAGSTCSAETSPWPPAASYFTTTEVNGLVTPLTATSSIDQSFAHHDLSAVHHNGGGGGGNGGGGGFYYAPPAPHAAHAGFAYPPPAHDPATGMMMHPHAAFEPNALGLENWSFGQFDLPDLSNSSSWSHGNHSTATAGAASGGGDASFSLDSIDSVPRTPSPGPVTATNGANAGMDAEGGLRLDLAKHGQMLQHPDQHALHPHLMGGNGGHHHAAEAYWLPPPPPQQPSTTANTTTTTTTAAGQLHHH
ncbi:hypothetical protein EX895_001116 [Sporisorium graminicola]|uniref:Subtelomeric hrmA-associated cluster protein AFUB-079030/YDR124W-like helical bundle domain-containing protein n=1 Tax=Sporisorium graminicola TaxID=280036 RepID=A0A4V6EUA0_9BASI|nr:hypothetical protein EX895_001116 [Sporisorium graminicola]TKY89819.1 hypothetical protein EX895_001116 [Sporisorium graminicola]